MAQVKVVTDSTSDIPKELADELNITVIPLKVNFGETETYTDGVTLTPPGFYKKLQEHEEMPTTSQPSPYDFETLYKKLAEDFDEETIIFSIHLSSQLSGTYQAATIAAEEVVSEVKVEVIDSKRASYAIGIIVVELARLAQKGADEKECRNRLDEMLEETTVYFMVDTLDYLHKNGRIGRASALLGSLLRMKPILSLNELGEVYPYEKVRGKKKAYERIVAAVEQTYGSRPIHLGAADAISPDSVKELSEAVQSKMTVVSTVTTEIGAVIGAHVGPGTVAITATPASSEGS